LEHKGFVLRSGFQSGGETGHLVVKKGCGKGKGISEERTGDPGPPNPKKKMMCYTAAIVEQ